MRIVTHESQERYQLRNSTKEVSQILNPVVLPFI